MQRRVRVELSYGFSKGNLARLCTMRVFLFLVESDRACLSSESGLLLSGTSDVPTTGTSPRLSEQCYEIRGSLDSPL